jgi:hypothetical protein
MTVVSLDQAQVAQDQLELDLEDNPAVQGIGILKKTQGYAVQVNLLQNSEGEIPSVVEGVSVYCKVIGSSPLLGAHSVGEEQSLYLETRLQDVSDYLGYDPNPSSWTRFRYRLRLLLDPLKERPYAWIKNRIMKRALRRADTLTYTVNGTAQYGRFRNQDDYPEGLEAYLYIGSSTDQDPVWQLDFWLAGSDRHSVQEAWDQGSVACAPYTIWLPADQWSPEVVGEGIRRWYQRTFPSSTLPTLHMQIDWEMPEDPYTREKAQEGVGEENQRLLKKS